MHGCAELDVSGDRIPVEPHRVVVTVPRAAVTLAAPCHLHGTRMVRNLLERTFQLLGLGVPGEARVRLREVVRIGTEYVVLVRVAVFECTCVQVC